MSGKWTRRRFLETVGRVGGAAAVYESMVALGMVRVPDSAYAAPPQLPEGSGSGKTIVILGAGVAGLTAAYELKKRNLGWQAHRRFWELDNQIYGGISYINHYITQMWYPSNGYLFEEKGVLTGAYNYAKNAAYLGRQELPERLKIAAQGAHRLHGDAFTKAVPIDLGLSIAWHHVPYQLAGWADWDGVAAVHYETLLEPDGRVIIAGDQVSYLPGWQEGAMLSAHHVLDRITRERRVMLKAAPAAKHRAPSTRAMTEGSGRTRE